MQIVNMTTNESRNVSQLQYMAWPDHGVPDDAHAFIKFTDEVSTVSSWHNANNIQVRRARAGSLEPIVVHCSAGIGRTGVLILMETAMCLIEQNEPVYTLDIVKVMRDQRAMTVQNSVCLSILCLIITMNICRVNTSLCARRSCKRGMSSTFDRRAARPRCSFECGVIAYT